MLIVFGGSVGSTFGSVIGPVIGCVTDDLRVTVVTGVGDGNGRPTGVDGGGGCC